MPSTIVGPGDAPRRKDGWTVAPVWLTSRTSVRTSTRVLLFMMPPSGQRYRRYADRTPSVFLEVSFVYIPTPTKFCAVCESLGINQYSTELG